MTLFSRGGWRWLLGLVISLLFLWLLLRQVELGELRLIVSRFPIDSLLLALLLLGVDYTLRILRWWWMIRQLAPSVRPGDCVGPFLASVAVNNLLPLRLGDALRVVGFRAQLQAGAMGLLGVIMVERLLDLVALLLIFIVALGGGTGSLPAAVTDTIKLIGLLTAVLLLALLLFFRSFERFSHWLVSRPLLAKRGWTKGIGRHLDHLFSALRILRSPSLGIQLFSISLLAWLCEGGLFSVVVHTLDPQVVVTAPWLALSTSTLATLLPSSPGYVGTFDYFGMIGFTAQGVLPSTAVAAVLVIHLLLWAPLTLVGIIFLLRPGAGALRHGLSWPVRDDK